MDITLHPATGTTSQSQVHQAPVLLLPTVTETLCIPFNSIIRIEASSNYSKVFCKGRPFPVVVAKVLRWFEDRLPQHLFTRIHRTHLINKAHIVAVRYDHV